MISLKNKKALITGATGGIGQEIVKLLVKENCKVIALGRDIKKLSKLTKKYEVSAYRCDLKNSNFIKTVLSHIKNTYKSIDILINCAGVYLQKKIQNITEEDIDEVFAVNIKAPLLITKYVVQDMIKKKWGRIVNIGSIASYYGFPLNSIYCSSKHAILGMTRALRGELKNYNIRVYCISPAATKTKMGKQIKGENYNTFLNPKEVAEYVLFVIKFDKELISEEVRLNRFLRE